MANEQLETQVPPPRLSPRWWPFTLIVLLAALAIAVIRVWPGYSFQEKNIRTVGITVITLFLLMAWALFLSRMRWRTRFLTVGVAVLLLGLAAASLRIRGVSGDLLPILEWRFQRHPIESLDSPAPAGAAKPEAISIVPASTNDYPQYLGPHRTGVVDGPALRSDWHTDPPQLRWRQPIGPAWSGFAIRGERAITMEQRGESELVTCYDLASGALLWTHAEAAHYHTTIAGEGPRTTPTVEGDRVLAMGATGLLNCLDLATGSVRWRKDVPRDNQGAVGEWGVSCSPLVFGDLVIVTTGAGDGRALVAYRLADGERVWSGGNHRASYSSPVAVTLAGVPQILSFNAARVSAHAPADGQVLWEHPWPSGHPHITVPLAVEQDRVLVSSGYGVGSELLQVSQSPAEAGPGAMLASSSSPPSPAPALWRVQRVWKSNRLKSKFANLIHRGDHIYGLDDGILVCLDAATGRLVWKEGRYGHGQIIASGDLLLIMAENGDVVLVEAAPEELKELARFQALSGKTWNPPALAGRVLLVRNDQEAACFTLSAR